MYCPFISRGVVILVPGLTAIVAGAVGGSNKSERSGFVGLSFAVCSRMAAFTALATLRSLMAIRSDATGSFLWRDQRAPSGSPEILFSRAALLRNKSVARAHTRDFAMPGRPQPGA